MKRLMLALAAIAIFSTVGSALAAIPEQKVNLNNGTPAREMRVVPADGFFGCPTGKHVVMTYSTNVKVSALPASADRKVSLIRVRWYDAHLEKFFTHQWTTPLVWQDIYPDQVGWDGRELFWRIDLPLHGELIYVDFEGLQVANWAGITRAHGIARGPWCSTVWGSEEAGDIPVLTGYDPHP